MIDLKEYIYRILIESGNQKRATIHDIVHFMESNKWFGNRPSYKNGVVSITPEQAEKYKSPLLFFLSTPKDSVILLEKLIEKYPLTADFLKKFYEEKKMDEQDRFYINDFLLYNLQKDVFLYSEEAISQLVWTASIDLTKAHGDYLTYFLSWLKLMTKTKYQKDYLMEKRYTMTIQNAAYEFDEYIKLMYYLFCAEYIEDNNMYQKAAQSKDYTDAWLYMSLHFICSLRLTDLERIYHPDLPYSPEIVLQNIGSGTFSDYDARMVILSITKRMCLLPFTPNKTKKSSGIPFVKFSVPSSCEVHFGKLFALAEAHYQLSNTDTSLPLIRKISDYRRINRIMGEEIGSLFLESDFRSRSATKSYLQSIFMIADNMEGEHLDAPRVKGYIIAALARSHKGSYAEFASTTFEYLKDAKFSGLTPEFVAFELLERGPLSFIVSMLLDMITDHDYSKLDIKAQTSLIKKLGISAHEIETTVSVVRESQKNAISVLNETITKNTDIMQVLHRIGSGQAFSKQPECSCLLSALGIACPFDDTRQCIGCRFEISTKSTFFLLISEFNRLRNLYSMSTSTLEKSKYKKIITTIVLPKLSEALEQIKALYGDEVYEQFERMIKENT